MRAVVLTVLAMVLSGCLTPAVRESADHALIPYRVMNDSCSCERYTVKDPRAPVDYSVEAGYRVDGSITTRITLTIRNGSQDTLDLSLATVQVSSRNVPYRYNNLFLPLQRGPVLPGQEETVTLNGTTGDMESGDPRLKMAGEELVLTLKGLRLEGATLASQAIRFVPVNPQFGE